MFTTKKIESSKRICLRLKDAREAKKISLDRLAKQLRMSKQYIEAIETCRFDDLPFSRMYIKKLLAAYARALGEDEKTVVAQFLFEEGGQKNTQTKSVTPPSLNRTQTGTWLSNAPVVAKTIGALTLFALVGLYFFIQIQAILRAPDITLISPPENFISTEAQVTLEGSTAPKAALRVNGKEVRTLEDGLFEETVSLQRGVNRIVIESQNRHSDVAQLIRTVVYTPDALPSITRITNETSTPTE